LLNGIRAENGGIGGAASWDEKREPGDEGDDLPMKRVRRGSGEN
jgi:hypothetical protein